MFYKQYIDINMNKSEKSSLKNKGSYRRNMSFRSKELKQIDKGINRFELREFLVILEFKNIMRRRWTTSDQCIKIE